jgi:hypothetical protein
MHRRGKTAGIWKKADMMIVFNAKSSFSIRHLKK